MRTLRFSLCQHTFGYKPCAKTDVTYSEDLRKCNYTDGSTNHIQITIGSVKIEIYGRETDFTKSRVDQNIFQLLFGVVRHAESWQIELFVIAKILLSEFPLLSANTGTVTFHA